MAYPESLSTAEDLLALLRKKEFAQLKINKKLIQGIKTPNEQTITDILSDNPLTKFNDLFLDPLIQKENIMILHSYQQFVRNLINPNTPYTRFLLKHATGMGKTIEALSIAKLFIKFYALQHSLTEESGYSQTPMIYIIGFSKQIFQRELLRRPEFGFITKEEISEFKRLHYLAEVGSQSDRDTFIEFESRIKKRLSKKSRGGFFKFFGYKEFFNRLFIFSEGYLPGIKEVESETPSTENGLVVEEAILTEDQIIQGLRSKKITLNFELIDSFANSLIIGDEIHNVFNSSEMNNYGIAIRMILNIFDVPDQINKIVELGEDRMKMLKNSSLRAIFMSATPINNSPTEIIDLLNLLIPLSTLPDEKKLEKEDFFIDSRNLKKGALDKIHHLIRGYVSFLRDDNPKYFPERKFEGEDIKIPLNLLDDRVSFYKGTIIPYLKFIRCPMSEFHQRTYDAVYKGTLPPDGQSLVDMVLPNPGIIEEEKDIGLFRTKDIKYSLLNASQTWKDKNQISLEKISGTNTLIITGEFMRRKNLIKYSTKYAFMIDHLMDNLYNDKGKVIISHQYVKMSGVLFIQEVLRRNGFIDEYTNPTDDTLCSRCGFTREEHSDKKKQHDHEYMPARFITYYGDIDRPTLDKSLEKFKSPENVNGYHYRILIGSKMINEGIDFTAVQNIWIMVAPANIPTVIQIFGRAIRKNSHILLPPEKRVVRIKIFVSSLSGKGSKSDLSYEEKKYFEKSQDYLVVQQIDKVFNEMSLDAVINRDIIMPPEMIKQTRNHDGHDLGALYFEPDPIFGKKWLAIAKGEEDIKLKDLDLTTFKIYHSDEEIANIIYIIKRLFIEQSTVWRYEDLWENVRHPPFDMHVNPTLFLEEDFLIALNLLTELDKHSIDTYQITTNTLKGGENIARLFDHLDTRIIVNERECRIMYVQGYYILFPIINLTNQEMEANETSDITSPVDLSRADKTPASYLGVSSLNLSGLPDIDIDNWHRQSEDIENSTLRITRYLKTSNISYNQMKFKFYNQFKDTPIEELPTSIEVYDLDFHSKLVEDAIRYAFNVLTQPDMPFSELHEFYFKMLYFYDRLELILFADCLEGTKLIEHYKEYITKANIKYEVYDTKVKKKVLEEEHEYNPFLMSSIIKSTGTHTFNINRLNDFLGKRILSKDIKKKHPKLEDMNIAKQLGQVSKKITKVFSNMLPVGHFLNTSIESANVIAVPKLYLPELDPDLHQKEQQKNYPWVRAYEFVQYNEPLNSVENDIIVGYYEKNPSGIDIKFKLRLPMHKIILHEDTRMIERGSACNTRKKEDLIKIAEDLGLDVKDIQKDESSIKTICTEIKLELMHREMKERRKVRHLSDKQKKEYKQVRYFYLHYEQQLWQP